MKRISQAVAICLTVQIFSTSPVFAQKSSLTVAQLAPVVEVPQFGTFYSLTLFQPPFPFNPFPELPVYAVGDGSFVYDDRSVDYVAWRALWAQESAVLHISTRHAVDALASCTAT